MNIDSCTHTLESYWLKGDRCGLPAKRWFSAFGSAVGYCKRHAVYPAVSLWKEISREEALLMEVHES
jgi:hypothetical protein